LGAPYTLSFFAGFVRDFLDAVGWLFRLLTVRGVGERFLRRSTRPGNARILRPF